MNRLPKNNLTSESNPPPAHDFSFIAGTILGIAMGLYASRQELSQISQSSLKKILHEYTDKIPDQVDVLVDQVWETAFTAKPTPKPIRSLASSKKNFFTQIKRIFKI